MKDDIIGAVLPLDDELGFRDAWVCPRCLRIELSLDEHWQHLRQSKKCMAKTLARGRAAGACSCIGPGLKIRRSCACQYGKRGKKRRR